MRKQTWVLGVHVRTDKQGGGAGMNNKRICNMLSDFISVAERPVIAAGKVYRERSGNVYMDLEVRDSILELMAQSHCRNIGFGTYDCYEDTMDGHSVDGCLVGEINRLNNEGIKTIGCCCGHGKKLGYIQVAPEDVPQMAAIGYIGQTESQWCFTPKTPLPKGEEAQP